MISHRKLRTLFKNAMDCEYLALHLPARAYRWLPRVPRSEGY